MKVSLNIVKQYTNADLSVDELVAKINQQLGQVDEVIDLGEKYKDVVVVKVVACQKHPNADKLSVCLIDDDGVVADVPRNEHGYVEVVCGAPNVREGLFVAWLPPKSTVPASFGDAEPFVLEARELRGILSQGMLAAADELAIGSDHNGIIELTDADLSPIGETRTLAPGQSFAELFGLNDTIIDIENKMFTHRPDLFGQLGVAREIAGIQQIQFTSPEWYVNPVSFEGAEGLSLNVFNDAGEKVPRFMAVAITGVSVGPSPFWLQCELVRLGSKPINNIVDSTNYVMLLTAQPTHAYDYDKLRGGVIGTRMAKAGETTTLLNGKVYELTESDIVIVDGGGIVGLGGVMGGGNSEVSSDTKNIVLEVANFDMFTVRKTSMRHGIFTDAVTRFTKGQSPLQNAVVLNLLFGSVLDMAGGKQASRVFDEHQSLPSLQAIKTKPEFINTRLGLSLDPKTIETLLSNVEFGVDTGETDDAVRWFTAPYWRTDIELPEDIVEEVGRLYGFDKLPSELPMRSIKPAAKNPVFEMKTRVRNELSRAGANEVLTYSFVHENTLKKAEQDPTQAYKLGNALSPDLQYYRLSILPSLLDKVHGNIKSGYDEFALFEFGKAHRKGDNDDEGLPREYGRLAFVYAAKKSDKTPYFTARSYIDVIAPNIAFVPLEGFDYSEYAVFEQLAKPFDPKRSAVLMDGERFVGVVGEFRSSVRKGFKLPDHSAGFELFQSYLLKQEPKAYIPLSRYPSVTQDISLRVNSSMPQDKLFEVARGALQATQLSQTTMHLETIGIYQPEDSDTKTLTLRLKVTSYERTLTDAEVSTYLDVIVQSAAQELQAIRV